MKHQRCSKNDNTSISTKNKLNDLLRLSVNAYKKIEGLSYRRYHRDIKLQLELIDYYKLLVYYSNQLAVTYKNEISDIIWSDLDGLEDALVSEDFGINVQLLWEITENDLPKLVSFIKKKLNEQNQSS